MRIVLVLLGLLVVGMLVYQQLGTGSRLQADTDASPLTKPAEVEQTMNEMMDEHARRLQQRTEY